LAKNGLVFVFVINPTMILSAAKAGADASAHAASAQAVIVFQCAPRRGPTFLIMASSSWASTLSLAFVSDDDQRDEAKSSMARWQTSISIFRILPTAA
jgi:hypothetical protein